ncbi:MAG: aldehyde dehydrogenase [Thermodesulfobacteriota bacterium]
MDIARAVEAHRTYFKTGKTLDVDFRRNSLKKLKSALFRYEDKLYDAFWADLHKAPFEVFGTEIGLVSKEIGLHARNIRKWARPRRVLTDLLNFYSTSRVYHEPYGVVMIMSPWNYPLQLALLPLVGAISAGNCVMLKPAHYSEYVSEVIRELVSDTFDPAYISVVTGGRAVNQAVLDERFDYIFFTGSPYLGKIVMEKAAKHLTPVTLELGGKSPCIVAADADVDVAAQRICFGKFLNAGQTCIAPDYLFVHVDVKKQLVDRMRQCIRRFYGPDPEQSPDLVRIINDAQFTRLETLMHSAGTILHGGRVNRDTRYIEPTLIDRITPDDPIMQEEIFGPLLPILEYTHLDEVIAFINAREKPLAMYFFSASRKPRERLISATSSGGGCVNETVMHISNPRMPFGGVGNSGMGCYHGKYSFDAFSHQRSILRKTTLFNPTLGYPPYGNKLRFTRRILS